LEALIQIGFFAALVAVGLFAGRANERRHLRELAVHETELRHILVYTQRQLPQQPVASGRLVVGSVVIAEDYFKRLASGLRSLIGGRLAAYESLVERGRREAIVRMKKEARRLGATMIYNVRLETASLAEDRSARSPMFSAEFIAYGTALVPMNPDSRSPPYTH
jgi:uncharacterized protein YbjQ (UPF0145 family)